MKTQALAKLAYQINRLFSQAVGDQVKPYNKEQEDATLQGIEDFKKNPSTSPKEAHDKWVSAKKASGWVFGPKKDAVKKTHPNILPYGALTKEQKAKDEIFIAVMKGVT